MCSPAILLHGLHCDVSMGLIFLVNLAALSIWQSLGVVCSAMAALMNLRI